ncbi:hypothetical protein F503_07172 [Ophiostoma piceae UAMH 11346]|uniref:Uncharacterized protein n=1 Tax=Ophiostoma piceae (strain UAMH 11346) TaxID=1262450 RepID=S3CBQ0_OPHP1|nr:hypothetical protein F503_07172 [Ophiostoma piceae UAMH 11346]
MCYYDGYNVIWVREQSCYGYEAGVLPQSTLDHPHRSADELFRWHFCQAVLFDMKAAAEPIVEHDFPPGSDMLEDIRTAPKRPSTWRQSFSAA